jgi:GNAT superfamily N-acetyltransferase
VVAHAGWEREPDRPERAEVAFAIADAMQHNGLGTILLGQLIEAADQAGVAVLSAEVLEGCANAFMQLVGTRAGDRRVGRVDAQRRSPRR